MGCDAPSSPRYSCSDPFAPNMGVGVMFEAPELPEETLMEVRGGVRGEECAWFPVECPRLCQ